MSTVVSGVYQIINKVNGNKYIGSSINLKKRKSRHWFDLKKGSHHSIILQRAWDKYGKKAFSFEVLEYVININQLIEREQYYLDLLVPKYNISKTASSQLGVKRSVETKLKLSEALMGRKLTEETKQKIRGSLRGRKRTYSKEFIDNLIARNKKGLCKGTTKNFSASTIADLIKRNKERAGWTQTIETREKRGKLTFSQVEEIKQLVNSGELLQKEIAIMYNICCSHVSRIKTGRRWAV